MNLQEQIQSLAAHGEGIQLLHTKLDELGYRIPPGEVERAVFGEGTRQAILDFQRKRGLQPTGIVDEHTAQIINAAVEAHRPVPERFIIGGQVQHQDGTLLEGMAVRAFDSDLRRMTQLGDDALTDQSGRYEVSIAAAKVAELEKRRPDLLVRVFSPEGAPLAESEVRRKADDRETVDLVVVPRVEIAEVKEQVHTISLRLVDRETAGLLDGYTVRAFDLNSGGEPRDLGFDITNARGLFSIVYASAPREEEGRFRLHIINREGKEIAREEIHVDPRAEEVVEVAVRVPAVPERPSPRLEELRERLQLELPHELLQRLERENISTIADIRKAGGISRLKDLPVPADHPAVRTLEAHANLSALSDDVEMNEALIRRGFTDINAIANTPGSVFLKTMGGEMDDLVAPQVYKRARAQGAFLENVMVKELADNANGYVKSPRVAHLLKCACRDSESAVSPLAYLADLLDYTLKHLKVIFPWDGQTYPRKDMDLKYLESRFYQPFAELPASCDEMETQVRQVRLCIEVLRRYLSDKQLPAADSLKAKALADAEDAYRLGIYRSSLTRLGTSHEEIRLALHAEQEEREALGERLGIALNATRVKKLLLTPRTRTDENIERLFGLMSTGPARRNPLSGGVTLNDRQQQITRWKLEGVEWNRNTDPDGIVCLSLKSDPEGGYRVELYKSYADSRLKELLASGKRSDSAGTVQLTPDNSSGLSGSIDIDYVADTDRIELSAIPTVLSWRLQHLRTQWKESDWPEGPPPAGARPLVDPDLIDLADLRIEVKENPAQILWEGRSKKLNDLLKALREIRQSEERPLSGLEKMTNHMIGVGSLRVLARLEENSKEGNSIEAELEGYGLTNAAFTRLMSIRVLAEEDKEITDSEWAEIDDILIEAKKRREFFSQWRKEEKKQGVILGPHHFKLREKALTGYPPATPKALAKWRAALTDRLDWEDLLEARIDQEKSVITAFWDAVSKTEEETLSALRDALVMATDAVGNDLTARARWLTDRLLIDAQAGSCQQTTRIGQAIETIQNLLWSMRTGQLRDSHPDLEATPEFGEAFGEEWEWIGSYATWRSAMMVFLYPENILIPTLRKHQTPAFRQLAEGLRKRRNLNPEQGRREAKAYSDYYRDVCNLNVEATCHASTTVYDEQAEVPRTLFYIFARGRHTGTVYWSAYDPAASDQDYAQTFWAAVPELKNVTKVIGAHPYTMADKERYIYLFAQVRESGEEKLVFVRYNLQNRAWENESVELEAPEDVSEFHVVLCQNLENDRPGLIVNDRKTGRVYFRRLAPDGSDWEEEDFAQLRYKNQGELLVFSWKPSGNTSVDATSYTSISAAHAVAKESIVVILQSLLGNIGAFLFEAVYSSPGKSMWAELHGAVIGSNTEPGKKWIGSVRMKEADDKLFVCYLLGAERRLASISLPSMSVTNWAQRFAQYVEYLVPDSGKPSQKSERLTAHWSVGSSQVIRGSRFVLVKDNSSGLQVKADSVARLAPQVLGPYEIIDEQSQKELQDRRKLIEQAFGENSGPQSNLTYLEEAYYFVPVHIALQLQKHGHYIASLDRFRTVYDYTVPEESSTEERRKIYYGLVQEEKHAAGYQRVADWLRDPLNPHLIASTRPNTYTRFTILSIVRCLLDYADAEYTRDDSESVARARALYDIALDLLAAGELKQTLGYCDERIGALLIELLVEAPIEWNPAVWRLQDELKKVSAIQGVKEFQVVCAEVGNLLRTDEPWKNRLDQAQTLVDKALAQKATFRTVATVLETVRREPAAGYTALLSDGDIFDAANNIGKTALTGFNGGTMFLQTPIVSPGKLAYSYCISPNPVPHALKLKAELNLHKIRTCRNIAGMKRTLEPYAAATDQVSGLPQIGANGTLMLPGPTTLRPTQYRYSFLIERAKQLVNIAQQIEAAMLAALEKRDAEAYSQMKARQDIELAGAQVKLQTLKVQEAKDSVKLAELQQERAQIQADHYQQLLAEGLSTLETLALVFQEIAIAHYHAAAIATQAATFGIGGLGEIGTAMAATSTLFQMSASFERRRQEWEFQQALALQDVHIGSQQVAIAEDHVRVVGQEHDIALMQKDHARDTMEFLANKFTNVELYDWMIDVLEGVYSYFLHEATAVAKVAENQLAFERQATPPHYIQDDYWEAPSEDLAMATSLAGNGADRRGLTGSARLLQDIYQLDQYAIDTDKRKLQLSKTISLAALSPVEFQGLRETGVMTFRTPMEMFDRDFPGHYLRLIKRVRTSVVALIPPAQGIHAALSTTAASRAVIGSDLFQEVIVQRDPEMVAITSPREATGLFDLQQQPEMLLPFEGLGVDTTWEFRMPKAANRFDYDTIADVLLTIDYTALNSYDYYQQVIQTLKPKLSADRAFSFRHELSDEWYDLHHPELVEAPNEPMVVRWETRREDFPPNLERLKIQHVVLYFVRASGEKLEVPVDYLRFTEQGAKTHTGGGAVSIDGIISTRRGNGTSWIPITGKKVMGEWELSLKGSSPAKDKEIRDRFKKEMIENILFVITYSGDTPEWPT